MGRAIVRDPQVFLFDEPLSNLDAKLRVAMRTEIKELHQRLKTTTVYVTHDQIEAMTMADKIVVMHDGIVEQIGTPLELYDQPANQFVAGFIGSPAMNFLPGHVRVNGVATFEGPNGVKLPLKNAPAASDGQPVVYGVRPEHFTIADDGADAEIVVVEPTGAETQVFAKVGGEQVVAVFRERHEFRPGDKVRLQPDPARGSSVRRGDGQAHVATLRAPTVQRTTQYKYKIRERTMSDFDRRSVLKARPGRRSVAGRPRASSRCARRSGPTRRSRTRSMRVLRWKQFVQGDDDKFAEQTKKFTEKTGIKVQARHRELGRRAPEGRGRRQRRRRPGHHHRHDRRCAQIPGQAGRRDRRRRLSRQASMAAGIRSPSATARRARTGSRMPLGATGGCMIYRNSQVKAAGFDDFPKDTDGFLKLCQALKENNTPAGFALGNATGDANGWCHGWCGPSAARWSTRRTRW